MNTTALGASREAIKYHYSIGNEFYRLWLDSSLTYSGALWGPADTLEEAQLRKLEYHLNEARARGAKRVLDIGCGWGSALKMMVEQHEVAGAVGLTLSQAQADWIAQYAYPRVEVRCESWLDHQPAEPYDSIISIGAFEHFAKPGLSPNQKLAAYRAYFRRCHELLKPGSYMTIQTIAYGNVNPENLSRFIEQEVFPESNLPTVAEVAQASEGIFEITVLCNDRQDYERTLREWLTRLRSRRAEAVKLVEEAGVARYEKYLSLFIIGFHTGTMQLLRITFRRNDRPQKW